ncbi:hypothetical protein DCAR_0102261 [Daucus carota subsp. sativus]|uniref:Uncharacterized protein n=1 Tax=Daucus carota subsp. sativus TaxID=79200 RepID=A0A166GZN5_DAUCS|nr:PREDICTED: DNA-directed RNA polymerase III subunit RPC6 [Daucus carota subsp. sativus]XP_017241156.1 PREDICTED: DNA-directed RNA polymerase III subunit RPC6 [Daucus carota subsp. sativus]WOG83087.1 hypothetical protein DCAR_0102261 [Daucus carota subsp. sativus]
MSQLQDSMALKRKRGSQGPGTQSLGETDRNILALVRGKEDLGISIAELRRASNLPANQLNKAIKTLITGQLIKEVPNIKYKGGKHYMGAEFEPSKELTGGEWYADGKLNQDLIEFLKSTCKKIVAKLKVATAKGVHEFFVKYKVFKEDVSGQQIAQILNSMVLDNEILEVKSNGLAEYHSIPVGEVCYRCAPGGGLGEAAKNGAMVSIPCGVCPRINICTPDGVISPTTCVYYTKWLDF